MSTEPQGTAYRTDPRDAEILDLKSRLLNLQGAYDASKNVLDVERAAHSIRIAALEMKLKQGVVMRLVYRVFLTLCLLVWLLGSLALTVSPLVVMVRSNVGQDAVGGLVVCVLLGICAFAGLVYYLHSKGGE